MRDPLSWSFPILRLFRIIVRVHILFPVVAAGVIIRFAFMKDIVAGTWLDVAMILALLFVSVLLHEFGHCFGARMVEGDASEIMMWPLGGLAFCEVPHTPRANMITTICGPAVNLILCILTVVVFLALTDFSRQPIWHPIYMPTRIADTGAIRLYDWAGVGHDTTNPAVILVGRLFWVNWMLMLFNLVLIGFPMDGGRIFQCILWPYYGYHRATMAAVFAGFITALILGVIAIIGNEILLLCLALFIYISCRQEWIRQVMGAEEGVFGYDFSQGYTSLERDNPPPPRPRRPNFIQRWLQRRAARKLQREQELREAEERRMDELLDKIQKQGQQSLSDEERRFLTRVSARYRDRK